MATRPIPVSDAQWTVLLQSAQALLPVDRPHYLAALAEALRNEPLPLGDGSLQGLCGTRFSSNAQVRCHGNP